MQGSCLCGAVRYQVEGPMRDVVGCRCTQCRKQTGHFVAATAAPRGAVHVDGGQNITWFRSSPGVRRGFCRTCGSHLFWDSAGSDRLTVFAGSIDRPTGLRMTSHIFCADKSDYYDLEDGLPRHDAYPEGDPQVGP